MIYWRQFFWTGFVRLLVSCTKNAIKVLIGRTTYFDPRVVFFVLYVKQLVARQPIRYVTCDGFKSEGVGSQVLMTMNSIAFARALGLEYLHTPLKKTDHADRPMQEWITAWEDLFNLGDGELMAGQERNVVNFAWNYLDLTQCFRVDLDHALLDIIPELRGKYYKNKLPRTNHSVVIGIHLRRPSPSEKWGEEHWLWTAADAALRVASTARSIIEVLGKVCTIRVFSQGDDGEFTSFRQIGAELHLNADTVWTMEELIESDVMILAKGSSFSYVAAIICDGIKVYQPGADSPLGDWVEYDADGDMNSAQFERQLHELLARQNKMNALPNQTPVRR
jgi:hypothetical protein